jgi:hypothetical protein
MLVADLPEEKKKIGYEVTKVKVIRLPGYQVVAKKKISHEDTKAQRYK